MARMSAALGTACESAAGRKVLNRESKVLNSGAKCHGCVKQCKQWLCHTADSRQIGSGSQLTSTDEVLEQTGSRLQRNSETFKVSEFPLTKFVSGDLPDSEKLDAYRPLDPLRGVSLTNDDDIVTAGEGQALCHDRQGREASCVCIGVEGPS